MDELEKIELSPAESARIGDVLKAESSAMLEAGHRARDIRMEVELESHRLNDEMSRKMAESDAMSADYGLAFRELSDRMATTHGAAMQDWFDSESAFRESIRLALTNENRLSFDDIWKRASNPMVYRTGDDAGALLDQALQMENITADQTVALT